MSGSLFAGVIIDQAHPALDKIFHYKIPEDLKEKIQLGMRVLVPFGKGNKTIEGYVMSLDTETQVPYSKLKSIKKLMDSFPLILPELIP